MKKLIYLIVVTVAFGLIVAGCLPVVPPTEQGDLSTLTKTVPPVWVDDDYCDGCPNDGHTWGTDAFDTIQDGINNVAAGGTVNVAAGTYNEKVLVNKQLTLIGDPSTPSNVVVDALGTGTRPIKITADGCVLQGFKTINSESYYGSIGVWSNSNIIKDNIASDNSGSGIFLYGSSYNTIEKNNVSNNGAWGINLYSIWVSPSYIACDNNIIKNNIANNNGQEGIGFGALAINNNIEDNQVNGNTYSGIGFFRSSSNTIKDNTVNGNGAIGINIYGTSADPCTNFIIIGNTVNNNGGNANIELGGYCHNNIVENNTANAGRYGIRVSGNDNTIKNNTANDNSEDGMRLNGDNYTIEGNTCNLNAYRGIWLGGSEVTNSTIQNNTLNGNNVGILLWTCHSSTLTGNTINDNIRYGIQIASNSPDNSMNYNNIVGNGTYGVINEGTTEVDATCNWWGDDSGPSDVGPGTGDAVSANVDYNPWLTKTSSLVYTGAPQPETLVVLEATLSDSTLTGISGMDVEFYLDGNPVGNGITDSNGVARYELGQYAVGVYEVYASTICTLTSTKEFLAVYDPSAGFVTGGGWIYSEAGACASDPSAEGKATFGFVSKYKKGAAVPTGNTEFQFKAGDLNFHSDSYDWLVIAGDKAKYKGTGTINGAGEYGFMLTATDSDPDLFRIKIQDKIDDKVIYDNKKNFDDTGYDGTELGGGQIIVHKGK